MPLYTSSSVNSPLIPPKSVSKKSASSTKQPSENQGMGFHYQAGIPLQQPTHDANDKQNDGSSSSDAETKINIPSDGNNSTTKKPSRFCGIVIGLASAAACFVSTVFGAHEVLKGIMPDGNHDLNGRSQFINGSDTCYAYVNNPSRVECFSTSTQENLMLGFTLIIIGGSIVTVLLGAGTCAYKENKICRK